MRPSSYILQLAVCLSFMSPMVSAWPELRDYLPHRDTLIVRANKDPAPAASATDGTPTPTQPPSNTASDKSSASDTSGSDGPSTGNLNIATPLGTKTTSKGAKPTDKSSGKGSSSGNSTATDGDNTDDASPTHATFNILDPAGGAVMRTPAINQLGSPLYKIGDYITWGWNYTSLQGTPTAIDVLVTCSASSSLWTLTQNMTFQTSVLYVWDTQEQENDIEKPLLTAAYKLIIKDSDTGINARPEPGYLAPFGFQFGLYAKQTYVPFPEFKCLDCGSGAGSGFDSNALRLALTMCAVTVFSFTWFVAGLGLE